jgi:hypothetical protein
MKKSNYLSASISETQGVQIFAGEGRGPRRPRPAKTIAEAARPRARQPRWRPDGWVPMSCWSSATTTLAAWPPAAW